MMIITSVLLLSQGLKEAKMKNSTSNENSLLEKSLQKSKGFREYIAERLVYFSTNIDNYLASKPDTEIYDNPTYLLIEQSFEKNQNQNIDTITNFRLRLKLPKFKEKYGIEIWNKKESNDKSNDLRVDDFNENEEFNAEIGYFDKIREYLNFSTSIGLKLRIDKFDPFAKAKINREFNIVDAWKVDLTQMIFISNDDGFESTSSFEIFKIFNKTYKFSNYNEYFWQEKIRDDNFYNSLRLYQNLSSKDYLSYVISAETNNEDESSLTIKNYQTYVSYRHFIKKWLYYDIIPKYTWKRSRDFDAEYGIRINLGMFIGKN